MFILLLRDLFFFTAALAGLALPVWHRLGTTGGVERLALAVGGALILGYLGIFGLYVAGLSLAWFWLLPAAGFGAALWNRAAFSGLWRDEAVRGVVGRWLVLAGWCVGWHGLIITYNGSAWAGDWLEHYDRAHFFLLRWPLDHVFLGYYQLPARPPLVNLWLAGLMAQTGGGFAHYQVMTTLLGCLVLLPLTVLLEQWRADRRAQNLLLILLMLCPLFVQNATFPWTKLPAAFFVLLAITQLQPAAGALTARRLITAALLLAGGMLAHYSAGPWICALVMGGACWLRARWRDPALLRAVLLGGLLAGLLLATWLGWSAHAYGPTTTFLGNTTFALAPASPPLQRLANAGLNLWSTLSPIPADITSAHLAQTSLTGSWRDFWFQLFQLKLPFAFGTMGAAVLWWLMVRTRHSGTAGYWWLVGVVAVVLGTATHTKVDLLGLVHISLQPLVLLGLAWLAASAAALPRWLQRAWAVGVGLDFALGIVLHFAVQSLALERWLRPGLAIPDYLATLPWPANANWLGKAGLQLVFLGDILSPAFCLALLLLCGLAAGWRWSRPTVKLS